MYISFAEGDVVTVRNETFNRIVLNAVPVDGTMEQILNLSVPGEAKGMIIHSSKVQLIMTAEEKSLHDLLRGLTKEDHSGSPHS